MTLQEFMTKYGLSRHAARVLCEKGRFTIREGSFSVEKGPHRNSPYIITRVSDPPPEAPDPTLEIKREKMRVDIELKRQKLRETREADEARYKSAAAAMLREFLAPLREAFRQCNLTQEQAELINNALTESERRSGL